MNHELSAVLKDRIEAANFPFVDVLAGLVKVAEEAVPNDDNNTVKRNRFPVAWNTNLSGNCYVGQERDLVPNSGRRSIMYFEDGGANITPEGRNGNVGYSSTLTLVAWLNRDRLTGNPYEEVSGHLMAALIGRLQTRFENVGIFKRLTVKATRIPPQDQTLFSKYNYDETIRQYLMPPFQAFGIIFTSTFQVHPGCIDDLDFSNPSNC